MRLHDIEQCLQVIAMIFFTMTFDGDVIDVAFHGLALMIAGGGAIAC